jgi:uncharacterized protein YdaU (DUF1376 family)
MGFVWVFVGFPFAFVSVSKKNLSHYSITPLLQKDIRYHGYALLPQGRGQSMNYYKRHLGDYAKDAGHLSLVEHGAYTLLLDKLYASEKAIPEADAYRVTHAVSRPEREAVDAVLREFFFLDGDGWMHVRVREELDRAAERADQNRINGKSGGRPRKPAKTEDKGAPCPHQAIIALYHEVLPELPPVNDWPDMSATHLKNQWRKSAERQNLDWWRTFFDYVRKSDFLMGNKNDFQASLGWLVKPANFAKVVNGNYENRGRA